MNRALPQRLERAVLALCPEIETRLTKKRVATSVDEELLWLELVKCTLSSQVPYQLAHAFANAIHDAKLLGSNIYRTKPDFWHRKLSEILLTPLPINGRTRKYRFPNVRAAQLNMTRMRVISLNSSLSELIYGIDDVYEIRTTLIEVASGFGPKQASMFLRDIGRSLELAILDRHVLNYMRITKLVRQPVKNIGDLHSYSRLERRWQKYSSSLGYPAAYVDWAVWIVMQVARQERCL